MGGLTGTFTMEMSRSHDRVSPSNAGRVTQIFQGDSRIGHWQGPRTCYWSLRKTPVGLRRLDVVSHVRDLMRLPDVTLAA